MPTVYPREILEFPTYGQARRKTRHLTGRTIIHLHHRWWSVPDELPLAHWARVIAERANRPDHEDHRALAWQAWPA